MLKIFKNLRFRTKALIIFGSFALAFIFYCLAENLENHFLSMVCIIISLLLSIMYIFLSFYLVFKDNTKDRENSVSFAPNNVTEKNEIKENKPWTFPNVWLLPTGAKYKKYCYIENVAMAQNLDMIKDEDFLEFKEEIDNQYDCNAIALFRGDIKFGYFFKSSNTREMIRKYSKNNEYDIKIMVQNIDVEKQTMKIVVAFYHKVEFSKYALFETSLVKTGKMDYLFEEPRYKNIENIYENDWVTVEMESNYDSIEDSYIVKTDDGTELGELNKSSIEKLESKFSWYDADICAQVIEKFITNNYTYNIKIKIYAIPYCNTKDNTLKSELIK